MKKYVTLLIVLGFSFAVNVSVMAWGDKCNGMAVNSEGVSPCSECGQNADIDVYSGGYGQSYCDAHCDGGDYSGCYCDCS